MEPGIQGHLTGKSGKAKYNLPESEVQSVVHGVKYSVHAVEYSVHAVKYSVHAVNYRLRLTAGNFSVRFSGLSTLLFRTLFRNRAVPAVPRMPLQGKNTENSHGYGIIV